MSYRQLTLDERYQIYALRKQHFTFAAIARALGRHRTTVSREYRRNQGERSMCVGYLPTVAAEKAHQRRVEKGARSWKIQGELKLLVENGLKLSWSPEQVSGRLLLEHNIKLTFETIYQHIMRAERDGNRLLRAAMRRRRVRRPRTKASSASERARAKNRHIDDRPSAADDRSELGHWERDTIVGARGKSVLLTIADRQSRFVKITRVAEPTDAAVARATVRSLTELPVKSVTNDNGSEFRRNERLERHLRAPVYFCDPSSPWQRGTVENTNGLIRQYVPKKTNFDKTNDSLITAIEETLNHRPRKTLGFRTPHEVFFDEKSTLMTKRMRVHFGLEFRSCQLNSPI